MNLLCDNLKEAKANRERVKTKDDLPFYQQQRRATDQWRWGKPAPETLIMGELPVIKKRIRVDEGLDTD